MTKLGGGGGFKAAPIAHVESIQDDVCRKLLSLLLSYCMVHIQMKFCIG